MDAAALVKRLDDATQKSLRHLRAAKVSATAAEVIIEQLKAKEAIVELTSYELSALTESADPDLKEAPARGPHRSVAMLPSAMSYARD